MIGMMKAGYALFLLSPRNAHVAVADMLQRMGVSDIFVSADTPMQETASAALASLAKSGVVVKQHAMPVFDDLFPEKVDPNSPFEADVELSPVRDPTATSVILHSSGKFSSSFASPALNAPCCFRIYRPPEAHSMDSPSSH